MQLAVGLHADAAAQIVDHKHLLGFRQAKFPGDAGVLDRRQRRSARAAVMAADQNDIGMRLGHSGRDDPHAHFGDQLHGNPRLRIHVLQIVDQLRQILDRIDVVMRRRRNQLHARNGVPHPGDDFVHLVARKLAAFSRLCALSDFDLQLVRIHQIIRRYAKASRRHLLDRASAPVSVRVPGEALFIFAALARVGPGADAIHGDRQGFVRFLADGAEGHGAGGESFDDFARRLDFVQGKRMRGFLEFHEPAQSAQLPALIVDQSANTPDRSRSWTPARHAAAC